MDAWSSPWNDDDGVAQPAASSSVVNADNKAPPLALPPLPTFDASDPWSTDVATPQPTEKSSSSSNQSPSHQTQSQDHEATKYIAPSSPMQTLSAWGDDAFPTSAPSDVPTAPSASNLKPPPGNDLQTSAAGEQSSSHDPWGAGSSSDWGAAEPTFRPSISTLADPDADSSGWGPPSTSFGQGDSLESRLSSTDLADAQPGPSSFGLNDSSLDADSNEQKEASGTNIDVWAAEASSREEKARHLDREEIDQLKSDARKLIASINTDSDTQASFASPSVSQGGWTDLFGSEGSQRDKLHHLQSPPSALQSSSGALRLDVMQSSPTTLTHVRGSMASTENRGVKLVAPDHNASWQRGARPITKAGWLPDMLADDAGASSGQTRLSSESAATRTSGPGWTQTSSSDSRSTSGPGFLASFFKGRQAGSETAASSPDLNQSQPPKAQSNDARTSTSSSRGAMSPAPQFDSYQDEAGSKYTDDPTGPDLLSLDQPPPPASAPASSAAGAAAPAAGAGLLSRWRNSGLFKSSTKKAHPSWASASMKGDDLAWLDEQESSDSPSHKYRYDEVGEDSFDTFQNRNVVPPPSHTRPNASSPPPDPFDALFGPATPQVGGSSASPAAPSSARSSLSAQRASGEGGMMTITTNLVRANSLARKGAASPLQPPPTGQGKRMSIAPPPRVSTASPRVQSPSYGSAQQQPTAAADPFAEFLSEPPPQPSAPKAVPAQPVASAKQGAAKPNASGALTADDLLFFDNF
ncbi:hypothetical protein PaG_00433 [Moesziomyces aphidis]|uniref:Uncharacterized protein n=1 Tax=Moesziomyces aphidis TaxID=84754 RepID=W3VW24_MOEAP|nr:hypothetical protein PaG_00433 [Moesziomyces aphidis]